VRDVNDQERRAGSLRDRPQKVEGDVRVLGVPEVQDATDQGMRGFPLQRALGSPLRGVIASADPETWSI
jgi:hypothetical protein